MRLFRRLFYAIFGQLLWEPPGWGMALGRELRAHLKFVLIGTLTVMVTGQQIHAWYKSRPQSQKVVITVEGPGVTKLEKELKPSNLVLRFSEPAAPIEKIGKPAQGVRMEPAMSGEWRWLEGKVLVFIPASDWPANTKYKVRLEKKALAPNIILDRHTLEMATPAFSVSVRKFEFYQDPVNPGIKQTVATLEFSHTVSREKLEKYIALNMVGGSAVFGNNTPLYKLDYGLHGRIIYLRSAPLALPEREDFMKLIVKQGLRTTQGSAALGGDVEEKVRVPDIYSFFRIESANGSIVRDKEGDPEQVVFINTTAEAESGKISEALELFILPARKDFTEGEEFDQWKSQNEINEEVLKKATVAKPELIPSEKEHSKQHAFKIRMESKGELYLRIRKGVRALGDFILRDDYSAVIPVPQPAAEIQIQGEGGVLALNGDRKLSLKSRGVPVIEYEIARIPADQINHLVSQTHGEFQNPTFVNSYLFNETNIARIARERQTVNSESCFKANYSTFDFTNHLAPAADGGSPMQGLFLLQARGWDSETQGYMNGAEARRFILVTDIGILVKENANNSRTVFLQSLQKQEPLSGIQVQVLGRNGVPVVSGVTSGDGRVEFPALNTSLNEKAPIAIVARNGSDVAFIPYSRSDRSLNFSRFDVGGVMSLSGEELDAFVFTERGVYRPGDTIHCAFTVKQRNWGGDIAGLPVETEIVDARGTSVQVKKFVLPASGFLEFDFQSTYASPTGEYYLSVYLLRDGRRGIMLGSTSAVLKEFQPDRMKMDVQLSKNGGGWIDPKEVRASVALRNLYGTPATERKITARLELIPGAFLFEKYEGYTFFDSLRKSDDEVRSESVELGERKTDGEGNTGFDLNLERFANATYRMNFYAEGFEAEGGRSVHAQSSALVSSSPYVVGHKPDGNLAYVKVNSERNVRYIAVDRDLKTIAVEKLQLDVIEQKYVSVLTRQEDGTYAYDSVRKEKIIRSEPVSIPEGELVYTLPTQNPGDYILELRNPEGVRISKVGFRVVGLGEVASALDKNAELQVKLDRENYVAGEEIEVSITAPYTGSGLITIERDKVYAYKWFKAERTGNVQRIKLPDDFNGTGYVNVSFIRALDSKEIFMSPLSYGVVPFTANKEKRRLKIDLQAPAKIKPGEPLTVKYKTGDKSSIILFAVDEGILQVTDYACPDPLEHYFRKSALTVGTSQIIDLLLPEYSVLKSSAFGGGGDVERHLNPFKRVTEKPVVFWSGILEADSTEREVIYNVPDYFSGTLTWMAVAVSPDTAGCAKKDIFVRGPFVITPGVPVFVAPTDVFEVGVTVANNVEGSGNDAAINLAVEASEHLEILGVPTQSLRISEGKETGAVFKIRAKEKLGSASLCFTASGNGENSSLRATLSVRPPMPLMTQVSSGNFTSSSTEVKTGRKMFPEFRELEAVVSSVPLGLAHGLDSYLKHYPNGCSEQITSGAFCRLMIADEADFGLTRPELFAQLENVFGVLRRRQNDQGGFGYWEPQDQDGIDFITVYVMHFLVEAKAAGFAPPVDMFRNGLRNLQQMVIKQPDNIGDARTVAYAIYLLTREEVITTNYILNLRDYLDKNHSKQWKRDLAGVYLAGALSLLKNNEQALDLIRSYELGKHDPRQFGDFYSPLGADSQYVAIVARHFPGLLKDISAREFEAVTKPIAEGNFSTLSAAYAVGALKNYSQHLATNPPALWIYETKGKQETELEAKGELLKRVTFSPDATQLRFVTKPAIKGMGAFYQVIETGFDKNLPTQSIADGLEIHRELVDGAGKPVTVAKLGEAVTVILKIRSTKNEYISNVSIVDLLPGGFEIVDSSISREECDYVDVREDRVVFFTSAQRNAQTIRYRIKPASRGKFILPPAFAESMYDRTLKARGLPGFMEVIDSK